MTNNEEYIKKVLDDRTLWEQLAEESSEVTKAALKFIRAAGYSNNPTPIDETNAYHDVIEEMRDLLCVCKLLGLDNIEPENEKLERWVKRISGQLDTPKGEVKLEKEGYDFDGEVVYKCSNCKMRMRTNRYHYCPKCGRYFYRSDNSKGNDHD